MPLFESHNNVSIKKITNPETEREFVPMFSLSELSATEKAAMDEYITEAFKNLNESLSDNSGAVFDAALLGYSRPKKPLLSRDLFDPRNIANWRARLTRTLDRQLHSYLQLEAAITAHAPEHRIGVMPVIRDAITEEVNKVRRDGSSLDWQGVLWICAMANIVEPSINFLTDEDWDTIAKSFTNINVQTVSTNPWRYMTAFQYIHILDPDFPLPITKDMWERFKFQMRDPDNATILGSITVSTSTALLILASGGLEVTASGIRLVPPQPRSKSSEQPVPIRNNI